MDTQKRAEVALKLLRVSMAADDQDATDFLADAIERDALYRHYATDAGEPILCMVALAAALNDDAGPIGTRPTASAARDNRPLCQMTTEERYQARKAMAGRMAAAGR